MTMIFDLTKIDRRIEKLRRLKEFLADPEMAELLEELSLSRNGNGATAQKTAKKEADKKREDVPLFPAGSPAEDISQAVMIRSAIAKMVGKFTAIDISRVLNSEGKKITAVQVGKVLRQMAAKDELDSEIKGPPFPTTFTRK